MTRVRSTRPARLRLAHHLDETVLVNGTFVYESVLDQDLPADTQLCIRSLLRRIRSGGLMHVEHE